MQGKAPLQYILFLHTVVTCLQLTKIFLRDQTSKAYLSYRTDKDEERCPISEGE
jgi:hypothetical protein